MAIVINVPRDERYGELGKGAGDLIGGVIKNRTAKKNQDIYNKVASGEMTLAEGSVLVSRSFLPQLEGAGSAFRSDNPLIDQVTTNSSGSRITSHTRTRSPAPGTTTLQQAKFNKPSTAHKASDKTSALNDIITTEGANWPVPASISERQVPAWQKRVARNVLAVPDMHTTEAKKNSDNDKHGSLTGKNEILNKYRLDALNGLARGTNEFEQEMNQGTLLKKANEYANTKYDQIQAAAAAQGIPEEELNKGDSPGVKEFLSSLFTAADVASTAFSVANEASQTLSDSRDTTGLPDILQDTAAVANVQQPPQQVPIQDRYFGSVRMVESYGIPVGPGYGMIDVGPGFPMIPQDVVDEYVFGDPAEATSLFFDIYRENEQVLALPAAVIKSIIEQNVNKDPVSFDAPATGPASEKEKPGIPAEPGQNEINDFMRQNLNSIPAVVPKTEGE